MSLWVIPWVVWGDSIQPSSRVWHGSISPSVMSHPFVRSWPATELPLSLRVTISFEQTLHTVPCISCDYTYCFYLLKDFGILWLLSIERIHLPRVRVEVVKEWSIQDLLWEISSAIFIWVGDATKTSVVWEYGSWSLFLWHTYPFQLIWPCWKQYW